jgi:hypothetical protein
MEDAVLTEFKFVNPHVYLYLKVPGEQGVLDHLGQSAGFSMHSD